MKRSILPLIIFFLSFFRLSANYLLVPMDDSQTDHLKSYGLVYWMLSEHDIEVDWLLNYRGGSFMAPVAQILINECIIRNISYEVISDAEADQIIGIVKNPDANMDDVKLQKAPKIAVYTPKSAQPWDDAVTLALSYAEIKYDKVFDDEVLDGKLPEYDWLHLHHEDFTGQYGKFITMRGQTWYQEQKAEAENTAQKYGYQKVSQLKLGVAKKIQEFVLGGGYMFAMCNATDTYDIALSANGLDIVESPYDGDGADINADAKLDFSQTFAFQNFHLIYDPYVTEFSDIDHTSRERKVNEANDYFDLFEFSAKWDPIPTMLTQNHQSVIKGFMGQTTAFKKQLIKPDVIVMAENRSLDEARYIHGTAGKGFWTFYGGHDPEDYQHYVGEEPTDLNLHPNSAGYRLILNNVLFPAAKKKKLKT
ncbi:asparagine synthetase B [Marinilongibacter aquaticus]|uniref:asparagine synthetase B n=1 Tax=Marinilongibacter aquaticus TaxID=2975157 RepID=UPI0021BD1275|nr:asparagine synthetase B [Marinilongibacter aquaticus]UBM58819.1 asparagine synthetase B [Marinilongibacter aquaticus]